MDEYCEYKRAGVICRKDKIAREMYKCIFERYEKALAENNGTEFKYSIMQDVLDGAAPSFFISPIAAYDFYCRAMRYKRSLSRK